MQIINIEGLARASAAVIVWPIVDSAEQPIEALAAAKLWIGGVPAIELTIGAGLSFTNSEIRATLSSEATADLVGAVPYELWVQIGPDKIAPIGGALSFLNTWARI